MDILSLRQHLGQMGMVESCVGALSQLPHLLSCLRHVVVAGFLPLFP